MLYWTKFIYEHIITRGKHGYRDNKKTKGAVDLPSLNGIRPFPTD